jgi:hypothetical protein
MNFMKRAMWAALLALPFAAPGVQAQSLHDSLVPPMQLNGGLTLNFNFFGGGGRTQLGPWYQYWPYEAHFQNPPPLGPGLAGPSFMTLPPSMGQPQNQWTPPSPTPVPSKTSAAPQRPSFQQVGYFSIGQAPTYWYSR